MRNLSFRLFKLTASNAPRAVFFLFPGLVLIPSLFAPSKAVFALAKGLREFPMALSVLSLRVCGITANGFSALANALRSNPGMALTLEELDLSQNQGTNAFLQWINEIHLFSPSLRRLALA